MDIESYHTKKVKYFVEAIGMAYCYKWKDFTKELGMQETEELKLVMKDEQNELFTEVKVSKIQHRKFDIAIASLKVTGPADSTINKPLPLKLEKPTTQMKMKMKIRNPLVLPPNKKLVT